MNVQDSFISSGTARCGRSGAASRRFAIALALATAVFALTPAALAQSGKVYWSWTDSNRIERADLDGTNRETIVFTSESPSGLDVDRTAGKVYWAGHGGYGSSELSRSELDGGSVEDVVTGQASPHGVSVDTVNGRVYWCDTDTDRVKRRNADGSGTVESIVSGIGTPIGIAVNPGEGKFYVTDRMAGRVLKFNLDGSGATTIVPGHSSTLHGIAVDPLNGHVYWGDSHNDVVRRADLDGTNVVDAFHVTDAKYVALDVEAGQMYVTTSQGTLWRAGLDGSSPTELFTGMGDLHGVAVDPAPSSASGACCLPDGSCLNLEEADCAGRGGSFFGGLGCSDIGCPSPTGASQESVDAIEAKLDAGLDVSTGQLRVEIAAVEAKLDAGLGVPTGALQADLAALEAKLDEGLDATVSSRADQRSVDAIEAKLDEGLDATVSSRADQRSVDAIEAKLDEGLDATVSSRADQGSVDAVEAKLDADLDASVSSRADQASVDDVAAAVRGLVLDVAAVEAKLDELDFDDLLRREIERELRGGPGNGQGHQAPIASFFLPESVGGRLELVSLIVADTILDAEAAGCDVHRARSDWESAQEEAAAGRWLEAWRRFTRSYREATRGPCN